MSLDTTLRLANTRLTNRFLERELPNKCVVAFAFAVVRFVSYGGRYSKVAKYVKVSFDGLC